MSEPAPIQEVTTQEGYARWAASYDREVNALIVLEETQTDPILDRLTFWRVLDVGAGTGRYALKLARKGASVTALDQSPEMLAIARQAAQQEGLAIDFHLAFLEADLPFAADRFDLVISALMLCHVPDLTHAAQEFARVLQPGGHLLITDMHPGCLSYGWRTRFRQAGVRYQLPNMEHTREDYLNAVAASGLAVQTVLDLPVKDLPPRDYPPPFTPEFIQQHGEVLFSLIIHAQK
jgi:ubiquinone/menaquinone biosynthesis C-methylase UbiE